jgi:hypothetical protein
VRKLFAEDAPQRLLQGFTAATNVFEQSGIHESLIVAAACGLYLGLEPRQDLIVEANRDPGLSGRERLHWTPLGSAEIVFVLHGSPSY